MRWALGALALPVAERGGPLAAPKAAHAAPQAISEVPVGPADLFWAGSLSDPPGRAVEVSPLGLEDQPLSRAAASDEDAAYFRGLGDPALLELAHAADEAGEMGHDDCHPPNKPTSFAADGDVCKEGLNGQKKIKFMTTCTPQCQSGYTPEPSEFTCKANGRLQGKHHGTGALEYRCIELIGEKACAAKCHDKGGVKEWKDKKEIGEAHDRCICALAAHALLALIALWA